MFFYMQGCWKYDGELLRGRGPTEKNKSGRYIYYIVLILNGNLEIGAHVRSELGNLIGLRLELFKICIEQKQSPI